MRVFKIINNVVSYCVVLKMAVNIKICMGIYEFTLTHSKQKQVKPGVFY